jgi:hypothetical protein
MIGKHPHIPLLTTSFKDDFSKNNKKHMPLKGGGEQWYVGVAAIISLTPPHTTPHHLS